MMLTSYVRIGVLGLLAVGLCCGVAPAQQASPAPAQPAAAQPEEASPMPEHFVAGTIELDGGAGYPYLLLLPPETAEAPEDGWPLVAFLHGAGERGDDNRAQLRHFPERMATADYRERFPCYLLAMQCPEGERWAEFDWRETGHQAQAEEPAPAIRAVMAVIEALVAERPIDMRRIYLTGLSMGGFGTWDLAARKPDWFAAIAPICGGGDPEAASAYEGLPIWAWHDEADPAVPVVLTRRMVEAARGAGADVRYDETTGRGHASWVPAYAADRVPAWLFGLSRAEPSEELAALRGSP